VCCIESRLLLTADVKATDPTKQYTLQPVIKVSTISAFEVKGQIRSLLFSVEPSAMSSPLKNASKSDWQFSSYGQFSYAKNAKIAHSQGQGQMLAKCDHFSSGSHHNAHLQPVTTIYDQLLVFVHTDRHTHGQMLLKTIPALPASYT